MTSILQTANDAAKISHTKINEKREIFEKNSIDKINNAINNGDTACCIYQSFQYEIFSEELLQELNDKGYIIKQKNGGLLSFPYYHISWGLKENYKYKMRNFGRKHLIKYK